MATAARRVVDSVIPGLAARDGSRRAAASPGANAMSGPEGRSERIIAIRRVLDLLDSAD